MKILEEFDFFSKRKITGAYPCRVVMDKIITNEKIIIFTQVAKLIGDGKLEILDYDGITKIIIK